MSDITFLTNSNFHGVNFMPVYLISMTIPSSTNIKIESFAEPIRMYVNLINKTNAADVTNQTR